MYIYTTINFFFFFYTYNKLVIYNKKWVYLRNVLVLSSLVLEMLLVKIKLGGTFLIKIIAKLAKFFPQYW
jgi:hypothetical protein